MRTQRSIARLAGTGISGALLSGLLLSLAACGTSAPVSTDSVLLSAAISGAVVGQHGKIRVTFSNPLGSSVDVSFSSSNPDVVHIADKASIPAGAISAEVQYDAMSLGQSFLTIESKGVLITNTATVVDSIRPSSANGSKVEVGATGLVYIYANANVPDPMEFSLAVADTNIIEAPATVSIPPFSSYAMAKVVAKAAGSTTVTAAAGGHATSAVMYVVDHARLAGVSANNSMIEAGGTARVYVSLDATVAKSTPIMVTSSNPAVAAAPVVVVPAGSSGVQVDVPVLSAGITDFRFTLADSSSTARLAAVDKARLTSFNVTSSVVPGVSGSVSAYVDAQVVAERVVMLSSSDPTVVAVPDRIVIPINQTGGQASFAGLKEGVAVITATLDGVVWKGTVHVGFDSGSVSLGLRSTFAAVGSIDELSIQLSGSQAASQVSLTSSDPTIATVPASITVTGSTAIPLAALKVGHTDITATVGGLSYTTTLTVVAAAAINQFGPTYNLKPGHSDSGYLYFNAIPTPGAKITFTSSDATVVPAPEDYYIVSGNTYVYFQLHGLKTGTAVLTASISGGPPASAVVYVGGESSAPAIYNNLSLNASSLQVGAVTYAALYMDQATADNVTATLTTSATGIVTLPQTTVTVSAGSQYAYFPIVGAAAGTVDLSATIGTTKKTVTITVVTTPMYSLSLNGGVNVGGVVLATVQANCVLAANVVFNLASSMPTIATVSAPTLTLAPGQNNPNATFAVTGVTAGMTNITAVSGATTLTAPLTVAP